MPLRQENDTYVTLFAIFIIIFGYIFVIFFTKRHFFQWVTGNWWMRSNKSHNIHKQQYFDTIVTCFQICTKYKNNSTSSVIIGHFIIFRAFWNFLNYIVHNNSLRKYCKPCKTNEMYILAILSKWNDIFVTEVMMEYILCSMGNMIYRCLFFLLNDVCKVNGNAF